MRVNMNTSRKMCSIAVMDRLPLELDVMVLLDFEADNERRGESN